MATKSSFISDFTLVFQIKFSLLTLTCLYVSNYYLYNEYLRYNLGGGYFSALVTLSELERALATLLFLTFLAQTLFFFLCSVALILYFKRKLIGVIYRFDKLLRNIKEGDLQQIIQNRENDQIKSLFSALNSLTLSLSKVYSSIAGVEKNLVKHIHQQSTSDDLFLQNLRLQIAQTRLLLGQAEERE